MWIYDFDGFRGKMRVHLRVESERIQPIDSN